MKGMRQVQEGFLSPESTETWIVCVCHSEGDLNAFQQGMVIGARRTGLSLSRMVAAGMFTLNRFPCVHHPKENKPTWHNCGKHWSQYGPASLWNALDTLQCQCPDELRLFWGQKRVQLNIRKVLLMFCPLSIDGIISSIDQGYSTITRSGTCWFPVIPDNCTHLVSQV